jgi:hypothetical protein
MVSRVLTRVFLLMVVFTLFTTPAFATSWYVDADAGGGSGCGAVGTPCSTITELESEQTLAAQDIVYFDSTDTWNFTGTAFSVVGGVQYIGNSWPSADTDCSDGGCAKFNKTGTSGENIELNADDATYETIITGIEVDGNGISGDGVSIQTDGSHLTGATKRLEDSYIHDCGEVTPTSDWSYCIIAGGSGGYDVDDVEILNNTVTGSNSVGIALYPANEHSTNTLSNVIARGNTSYDNGTRSAAGDYDVGIYAKNDVSNAYIEFNYLYNGNKCGVDTSANPVAGWKGPTNVHIRYNVITANTKGIDINAADDSTIWIYGNLIHSNTQHGIFVHSAVPAAAENVFQVYIFNNTIYDNGQVDDSNDYSIRVDNVASATETIEIKNNIFHAVKNNNRAFIDGSSGNNNITHTNNIYYRSQAGDFVWIDGSSYNCSEIASGDIGVTEDCVNPDFKNTGNLPTGFTGTYGTNMVPDNDGLSFDSGSDPPVGAGADLGGSPYYGAVNISGTNSSDTRDTLTPWDIGAYEYGAGAADSQPPTLSSSVIGGSIQ